MISVQLLLLTEQSKETMFPAAIHSSSQTIPVCRAIRSRLHGDAHIILNFYQLPICHIRSRLHASYGKRTRWVQVMFHGTCSWTCSEGMGTMSGASWGVTAARSEGMGTPGATW